MKKFSTEEDEFILDAESKGIPIRMVAKTLGRSNASIVARFGCLTYGKKTQIEPEVLTAEKVVDWLRNNGAMIVDGEIAIPETRLNKYSLNG